MRISDWSSDVCSSDLIYEPGCGNGSTLVAIHKSFPDAELIACDLSVEQLRAARRLTDKLGIPASLRQRDAATDTREPDESVDAVVTFALHHELPHAANVALLTEMFRILKPGRSEEHTSELQSLMRISYAVFCLKKKKQST